MIGFVTRVLRVVAVTMLSVTLGGIPLVADWCATTCETAHADGVPACHHARSSMSRIGRAPSPCGHDHRPIVVDAATTTSISSRATTLPVVPAVDAAACAPSVAAIGKYTDPPASQSSPPLSLALASALRI
jgi:hypothetical protein